MNHMLDTLFTRRSIRKYKSTQVEQEKVDAILRAAMYAPSACDCRPWHFIVCDDRSVLDAIQKAHPYSSMLRQAPLCIAICGDTTLEAAPDYYKVDCGLAMENLVLAAWELGLGTCILGVCPRPERMREITELFSLPAHIKPYALVAVGYPDEQRTVQERFDSSRVRHNAW